MNAKTKIGFSKKNSNNSHGHILTPLVDCFAIILVYLLMATSFGEIDLDINKDIELPKAAHSQALVESTVVKVSKHSYEVAGKQVSMRDLAEEFKKIFDSKKSADQKANPAIVIQADRNLSYGEINPVVMAGLQAGFNEVQFAVLKEDVKK
jgi:biopolymer transport protein ExbD